jgi:hypothetical protein
MKRSQWYISLSLLLIAFSVVSYFVQIEIFHRTEDTFFYMLQDVAFVPIQVLLVTLILNQLLISRDRQILMKKLNMLIGTFHIEVGSHLIALCTEFSADSSPVRSRLMVSQKWSEKDFRDAAAFVRGADPGIDSRRSDLQTLKVFLESKRSFLLSLLANPNLLEHEAFTDLLWAVFHLAEELSARKGFDGLPRVDYDHLAGDIKRAYVQLLVQWLFYMQHLRGDYPYLFSLALRMNPLDPNADAVVKG